MFGFGKKKEQFAEQQDVQNEKIPSGMREMAQRMMAGQFDMNDMLAQLKQIKKMSNFGSTLNVIGNLKIKRQL